MSQVNKDDSDFIKSVKEKINSIKVKQMPTDSGLHFDSKSTDISATKQQFCMQLHSLIATHSLHDGAVNDILRLFRDNSTGLMLPLNPADSKTFNKKAINSNTINHYIRDDNKSMVTDVCRRNCMVFHGKQVNQRTGLVIDDCSKLMSCMVCDAPRYTQCSHKYCKKNQIPYNLCNPHSKPGGHSLKYRVPMKKVYYRSMIKKFIELYCLSQMEGHHNLLNYRNQRIQFPGKVVDILDGSVVKDAYTKMDEKYNKFEAKFKEKYPTKTLEKSCLTFSFFLDGVTNFKRKSDSMEPLFCSVLDCNPHFRSKLGTGLFLTLLHNLSHKSAAEKYLLDEMFTEEVIALQRGILFTIPATGGEGDERHIFLQARCIYAHLDTKALEKFARLKLSNSKVGCTLCNMQRGSYRPRLHK